MDPGAFDRQFERYRALFEQKFRRRSEAECWPWIAATNTRGIGIVGSLGELAPSSVSAPAAAWFFYRDPTYQFGVGSRCLHLCGNTGCVNPSHLAVVEKGVDLPTHEAMLRYLVLRYPDARPHLEAAIEVIGKAI